MPPRAASWMLCIVIWINVAAVAQSSEPSISPAALPSFKRSANRLWADLEDHVPARHPLRLIRRIVKLLRPHLQPVEFKNEAVLYAAGDEVERVYFPHSGIISLVVELAGGQAIEAAMVGRDSMVGATSAMDGAVSLNKAIIQLPGKGEALDTSHFRAAARQSETLRAILLRHEQLIFAQAQQSAACNASHKVEARLSRWPNRHIRRRYFGSGAPFFGGRTLH
jgi:CRP-like cAMP-binding protein